MKLQWNYVYLVSSILIGWSSIRGRSPHRKHDPELPYIVTSYVGDTTTYTLRDWHLGDVIFKVYDQQHFESHLLPNESISYRYDPTQSVNGAELTLLLENLLQEIDAGKKEFSDFVILKKLNFKVRHKVGLIVLRFKNYPFIVKLFIETPERFVKPLTKGREGHAFFYMGGGMGRHLAGLTRIKNLELVQQKIAQSPSWSERVGFPKKWHWIPKAPRPIEIKGYNIGPAKTNTVTIPGVYAVIAEQVIWEREFALSNSSDRDTALALCNYLNQMIDPHIDNFGIEQNSGKIVPIDFEHFPSNVGLTKRHTHSYFDWYSHLAGKGIRSAFGVTKQERKMLQYAEYHSELTDISLL